MVLRNLEPANLIVFKTEVQFKSFAQSRIPGKGQGRTGRMTRAGYTAPEVWGGQAHGTGADMWCLGVLLYKLSIGKHPFEGGDGGATACWSCCLPQRRFTHSCPSSMCSILLVSMLLIAPVTERALHQAPRPLTPACASCIFKPQPPSSFNLHRVRLHTS